MNVPKNLEKQKLCNALCKFATEVLKHTSDEYQPNSIKEVILSIQMYLTKCGLYWKLLSKHDEVFIQLFHVVDNLMKDKVAEGMGEVKSAVAISNAMEDKMWTSGVLGEHNPKQLLETVMFLLGINLALRGGEEHKRLRRPGFNPQINVGTDSEGIKCLIY